jgi:hypothetical protein
MNDKVNRIHKVIDRIVLSKYDVLDSVNITQFHDNNDVYDIRFTCNGEIDCKVQNKVEEDVLMLFISMGYSKTDNDITVLFTNDGIKWYKCYEVN